MIFSCGRSYTGVWVIQAWLRLSCHLTLYWIKCILRRGGKTCASAQGFHAQKHPLIRLYNVYSLCHILFLKIERLQGIVRNPSMEVIQPVPPPRESVSFNPVSLTMHNCHMYIHPCPQHHKRKKKVPRLHQVVSVLPLECSDFPSVHSFSIAGGLSSSKQDFSGRGMTGLSLGERQPLVPTSCAWKCGFVFHAYLKVQEYLKTKKEREICLKGTSLTSIYLAWDRRKQNTFFFVWGKNKKKLLKQADFFCVCTFLCV